MPPKRPIGKGPVKHAGKPTNGRPAATAAPMMPGGPASAKSSAAAAAALAAASRTVNGHSHAPLIPGPKMLARPPASAVLMNRPPALSVGLPPGLAAAGAYPRGPIIPSTMPGTGVARLLPQHHNQHVKEHTFIRVLMKYLEMKDKAMHSLASVKIKECQEKNKNGDPQFANLTDSMMKGLRDTVGEVYWKTGQEYHAHEMAKMAATAAGSSPRPMDITGGPGTSPNVPMGPAPTGIGVGPPNGPTGPIPGIGGGPPKASRARARSNSSNSRRSNSSSKSNVRDSPASQAERNARESALRSAATEDERRMRFLALLCGRGAFPPSGTSDPVAVDSQAALNLSNGGGLGEGTTVASILTPPTNGAAGGKGVNNLEHPNGAAPVTSVVAGTSVSAIAGVDLNYNPSQLQLPPAANLTPTTPQSLSRRILHRRGVGYLDDAVSLLLSALSDRFLATVLVQAVACRDRRVEGCRALAAERKARKRHGRRLWRRRRKRKRTDEEGKAKRRRMMVEAVEEGSKLNETVAAGMSPGGGSKTAASAAPAWNAKLPPVKVPMNMKRPAFQLTDEQKARMRDSRKEEADIDAEEDYYRSYYGKDGEGSDDDEEGYNYGDDTEANIGDGEDEDDIDDDSEEEDDDNDDEDEEDETQYDLLLRDLYRPLSAWGFDLSGKLGFDPAYPIEDLLEDDNDEDDDDVNADQNSDEESDDAILTDEDNGDQNSDEDSDDAMMTDEENGDSKMASSPPKKPAAASKTGSPTKKAPARRKPVAKAKDSTGGAASASSTATGESATKAKPKAKKRAAPRKKKATPATTAAAKKAKADAAAKAATGKSEVKQTKDNK